MTRRDVLDMLILLPAAVAAAFIVWVVLVAVFTA